MILADLTSNAAFAADYAAIYAAATARSAAEDDPDAAYTYADAAHEAATATYAAVLCLQGKANDHPRL